MKVPIEKLWHGIPIWECPYCRIDFNVESEALNHIHRYHRVDEPEVAAIMVTNRPDMARQAAFQFAAQSWSRKKLVVVSSSPRKAFDYGDLELEFVTAPKKATIGAMRNLALSVVRSQYATHWDDDEVYHARRIESYVDAVARSKVRLAGVHRHLYSDGERVLRYDTRTSYLTGATLFYESDLARVIRFPDVMIGEEEVFAQQCAKDGIPIGGLPEDLQVALVHGRNTSPKNLDNEAFHPTDFRFPLPPRSVVIGITTWEDDDVGLENIDHAARECLRWRRLGIDAVLVVADSGSGDNYRDRARSRLASSGCPYSFIVNPRLRGVSVTRNQILDEAASLNAEFIVFIDGDITVVPWSTMSLVWELAWMPDAACLGLWSGGCRSDGPPGTWPGSSRLVLSDSRDIAWTQYGAFRMEAFRDLRFETEGPFQEPGYGLEDVDIAWEFERRGWRIRHLTGLSYLHRSRSSSVRRLLSIGVDAADAWKDRFDFLAAKWRGLEPYESRLRDLPKWSPGKRE